MYRQLFLLFSLFVLFTLVGCGSPDPTPVAQATVASTETAAPTNTAVPPTETATEAPTDTPEPTETASATATETPTKVPTKTPTPEATETAVPTEIPTNPPTAALVSTNTAAPAPPAALPASGAPPTGPNLVVNPGFEYGVDGWQDATIISASVYPNFVRSGVNSASYARQRVQNVVPGETYRAGVWLKVWSSKGEDRTISENPGDYMGRICININGDDDIRLPTTICSGGFRPLDTWQYITVDAVPSVDRVFVIVHGFYTGPNKPYHNEVIWDDVELGLSPVAATPTPIPLGRPAPPAPVAFGAQAMRDSMNNTRSMLEQMGGLLDRLVRGSTESCEEYTNYYRGLVGSPRYDGVPGEWQGVYNEYIFAVDHGSLKNQPIFDLCFVDQGGGVTELNYGVARASVNDSLNRLIPAIETTNAMLGQ